MCAQFILKIKANELSKKFGISFPEALPEEYDIRARGFIKTDLAPVIFAENGKIKIKEMCFSLCPHWSAEFPYKWTSYNARMERVKVDRANKPLKDKSGKLISEFIYEVPTWRDSFNSGKTCLIPMNAAIESSYFGTHAGNIIQFSLPANEVYYVVGLWSEWVDKKTGEVKDTFTLITDDPYDFFFKSGHDRSVFLIDESQREKWLLDQTMKPKERFEFLRKNRVDQNWVVQSEREMAKGWQKRAPSEEEIKSIKIWHSSKLA